MKRDFEPDPKLDVRILKAVKKTEFNEYNSLSIFLDKFGFYNIAKQLSPNGGGSRLSCLTLEELDLIHQMIEQIFDDDQNPI